MRKIGWTVPLLTKNLAPIRCEHKVGKGQCTKLGTKRVWVEKYKNMKPVAMVEYYAAFCPVHARYVQGWKNDNNIS